MAEHDHVLHTRDCLQEAQAFLRLAHRRGQLDGALNADLAARLGHIERALGGVHRGAQE